MNVTTCLQLSLPAVPASVRRARNAVAEAAEELPLDPRLVDDVRLCVSEAVANVVRHAYGGPGRGDLHIVVDRHEDELEIVVRDSGRGMTRSPRSGTPGGYGMQIIDELAERVVVDSSPEAGTELRIYFPLRRRET